MSKTIQEALAYIQETQGKFFSVEFKKRTPPHEVRNMLARTGVTSKLKGGFAAYEFTEKSLISVFDVQAGGYRSVPIEGIQKIKIEGEWHEVTHPKRNAEKVYQEGAAKINKKPEGV